MSNLPALASTAVWAVLTATVYWLLMKWSGPTVVWTIVPGVARGVRDWVTEQPERRRSSSRASEAVPAPSPQPASPSGTPSPAGVAEIVEL